MTRVTWSGWKGRLCLRVTGVPPGANVSVYPPAHPDLGHLPPMAGRLVVDGGDVYFVPRFPFMEGCRYTVELDGAPIGVLVHPRRDRPATTEVLGIFPTAAEVPRNLLRLYVWFSAPMSEGMSARHLALVDDSDHPVEGALFRMDQELWDGERRRLTVLLDPARIKRGLLPHREAGYPLRTGGSVSVVVDSGFVDAAGAPLVAPGRRRYGIGGDERRHVAPETWVVSVPKCRSVDPLEVTFDRPLDHALLLRCLSIVSPAGTSVEGTAAVGSEERAWQFRPTTSWSSGEHFLVVDPILEDVAGNSVARVFDRDLSSVRDEPRAALPVRLAFVPR